MARILPESDEINVLVGLRRDNGGLYMVDEFELRRKVLRHIAELPERKYRKEVNIFTVNSRNRPTSRSLPSLHCKKTPGTFLSLSRHHRTGFRQIPFPDTASASPLKLFRFFRFLLPSSRFSNIRFRRDTPPTERVLRFAPLRPLSVIKKSGRS